MITAKVMIGKWSVVSTLFLTNNQAEGDSQATAHCKHFLDFIHFSASLSAKGVVTKEKQTSRSNRKVDCLVVNTLAWKAERIRNSFLFEGKRETREYSQAVQTNNSTLISPHHHPSRS
jgi:hypothetical protein